MNFVTELNKLGHPQKAFVKKADAKVIAVSCASVISAYLQNLHLDELAKEYGLLYDDIFANAIKVDIYDKVRNGKFSRKEEELSEKPLTKEQKEYYDKVEVFMEKLKNKGDNVLAEFFGPQAPYTLGAIQYISNNSHISAILRTFFALSAVYVA